MPLKQRSRRKPERPPETGTVSPRPFPGRFSFCPAGPRRLKGRAEYAIMGADRFPGHKKTEVLPIMNKRLFSLILLLVFVLSALPLYAGAESAAPAARTLEGKVYPCLRALRSDDEVTESEITLYFADGGDIPYVSLADFMDLFVQVQLERAEWEAAYDIQSPSEGMFLVTRPDNGSTMAVNSEDDTLFFMNFDLFTCMPGGNALITMLDLEEPHEADISTMTEKIAEMMRSGATESDGDMERMLDELLHAEAKQELFSLTARPYNRNGAPVTMRLADYNIDVIAQDGACYIPFQTLNDIFMPPLYVLFGFNGQAVIGSTKDGKFYEKMYEAEPREMSPEFAAFNFTELCFSLDHFYGLREEHGIGRFAEMLSLNSSLFTDMVCGDPARFDAALNRLAATYLDDGHTGYRRSSWYSGNQSAAATFLHMGSLGPSGMRKMGLQSRFEQARNAVYPDGAPAYEEIGDTAFITFDVFTIGHEDVGDYYHLENPDDPQDTIELVLYAHRQITREGSPIRNIVIDLSCNGGGNTTAAIFAISWFTARAVIALRSPLTGAQTVSTYMADTNLNGIFLNDPGDTVAGGQYNLYCLISPRSFSCANLLPACFKESGVVSLIGQKSAGGACVVRPCTTASGAVYQISGTKELSTVVNGTFYHIDRGVEPDIPLTKLESFFDRPGLVELIDAAR